MIETEELLRSYLEGIRHLSGAGSASLFVPVSHGGLAGPFLIHVGELPPCQELSDLTTAASWADQAREWIAEVDPSVSSDLPLTFSSRSPDTSLLPLPAVSSVWSRALPQSRPLSARAAARRRQGDAGPGTPASEAWLALRFSPGSGNLKERCRRPDPTSGIASADSSNWWEWLLLLGGALASHSSHMAAVVRDPVTGLHGRVGLLATLAEAVGRARDEEEPLCLLLINPDDFGSVNERFGRVIGDRLVTEIARRIQKALRRSDLVFRYGGVVFGVVLLRTTLGQGQAIGDKLLAALSGSGYLDGAVRLAFSAGVTLADPKAAWVSGESLLDRADRALNAVKRRGGGALIDSVTADALDETGNFDRLSGVFTGKVGDDYRHMVLLWDFLEVLSRKSGFAELAGEVVERLYSIFRPERLALCSSLAGPESLELVCGISRVGSGGREPMDAGSLRAGELRLMTRSLTDGVLTHELGKRDEESIPATRLAAPLLLDERQVGCLLFAGSEDAVALEESERRFLSALAPQLALALERARLAELEARRLEQGKRRLQSSLTDLRDAIREAKLLYRSPQMEAVVEMARRAAPTDVTVLITGPSGTGKELMARTVHQLSSRREKPLVVVDCGAIVKTLIESELFGHERGAYTGAEGRRSGRLAEADGGTLFLDEIGELPLDVQAKLLRFAQEKRFSRVGGTAEERVDARIVAATNRDLATEVAAGRFRHDLYYRLNVVNLRLPGLRERPDDILLLAQHFLSSLSLRYHKDVLGFTPAAEKCLLEHSWPGNVRELQNKILQAVILCERQLLSAPDLGFDGVEDRVEGRELVLPSEVVGALHPAVTTSDPSEVPRSLEDLEQALGPIVGRQRGSRETLALGRWLERELVVAASQNASGIPQAAASLGLARTTYRRRLERAAKDLPFETPPSWRPIRGILTSLVEAGGGQECSLLDLVRSSLLSQIREHGLDGRTGAALLGVSAPTYRRRLAELSEA